MAVDIVRPGDRLADALGQRHRVGRILDAGHDDGELVAAEPGDGVGRAGAAAQPLGDDLEQLVADRVAERIVDAFEVIEIEAEHGEALAALDPLELVFEALAQHGAIGQVGQRIVARHMHDALLGALALGDVLVGGDPAAAGNRRAHDGEDAAVGRLGDAGGRLALGDVLGEGSAI